MPKKTQPNFTTEAKVAMIRRNLTITALARKLGVTRTTVSLAINQKIHRPTLRRVAAELGLAEEAA